MEPRVRRFVRNSEIVGKSQLSFNAYSFPTVSSGTPGIAR